MKLRIFTHKSQKDVMCGSLDKLEIYERHPRLLQTYKLANLLTY
jgi:hypothetical protein